MAWPQYKSDMLKTLPKGSQANRERGHRVELLVLCSEGHHLREVLQKHIPPEAIRRKLSQQGWITKGKSWTCPKHSKKDKPLTRPQAPTDAARKAKREASAWIEEAFDLEAGRYRSGVTDKSIGEEVGLSEEAVSQIREDFIGPIKEPEEFGKWRAEISSIREDCHNL